MATHAEAKAGRRAAIIAAARALIREQGNDGFAMRALATRAGVSPATPYNLFGSKQAVLAAVLDEDLNEYEQALAALEGQGVDALFQSVALMTARLDEQPEYNRQVLAALGADGGAELRLVFSGPRYLLWKRLLRGATLAGELRGDIDPDALAITLCQGLFAVLQEWAQGILPLDAFDARSRYTLALGLLAVATPRGRPAVQQAFDRAQADLQAQWRAALRERLRSGDLDAITRSLLADQLAQLDEFKTSPKEAKA